MFGPIQKYIQWVRENEAGASGIERITRGVALMMANHESLLSMEGMWTVSKVHSLTNQWILNSKGRRVTAVELGTWAHQLLQETDALFEIYLRQSVSHKAGWLWVIAAHALKVVIRSLLQKERWASAFTTIRDVITALVSRRGRRSLSQPQKPRPLTTLVIPRVVSSTSSVQRPASWSDIGAFTVDLYVHLRSILLSVTAYAAFPAARNNTMSIYRPPPPTAPSTVESIRKSLVPQWAVWRLFTFCDFTALLVSHVVRKYRVPIVIADEEEESSRRQGGDGFESSTNTVEETEDDLRISQMRQLIAMNIFRDPFFSIVLKQSIYRHFVNGRLNRWIPIIGGVIANQVQYMLAMQQHSFLYTLQ